MSAPAPDGPFSVGDVVRVKVGINDRLDRLRYRVVAPATAPMGRPTRWVCVVVGDVPVGVGRAMRARPAELMLAGEPS